MNDDLAVQAVRKILMALQGLKRNPVALGALAHRAWGVKKDIDVIRFLVTAGAEHRQSILGAARGEGFQQAANPIGTDGPLTTIHLSFTTPKIGPDVAAVEILEAGTPILTKALSRGGERGVLNMPVPVASVEDLILLAAASGDQAAMVELLRSNAARMDAQYVKREAETAGLFDKVKAAWAEAKK
jgi:hypothetical protein